MIKNIVFDIGRVLVEFDPHGYLCSFGFSDATVRSLEQTVFGQHWNAYDRGDYATVNDLQRALVSLYPAYRKEIETVLTGDWVRMHVIKEDTAALLSSYKARGYRVYLLSNLAKESYDYISAMDFFRRVDGGVYSYQERACKPEAKLYETLLTRYSLKPEETVFLDDRTENVAAAERFGIRGIVFNDAASAAKTLEVLLCER